MEHNQLRCHLPHCEHGQGEQRLRENVSKRSKAERWSAGSPSVPQHQWLHLKKDLTFCSVGNSAVQFTELAV